MTISFAIWQSISTYFSSVIKLLLAMRRERRQARKYLVNHLCRGHNCAAPGRSHRRGLDGLGTLLKLLGNEEFHFNDPDSFDFVASSDPDPAYRQALEELKLALTAVGG
ncbi:unnamed protein product [Symbiodinium natans]|uniref:Uncharacterized protein n=1 Tax=Symbiodinium natans TaxID=878477 RepID=A0A812R8M5_9DINO|nr:unnamed protein product [Symbiodinium natans]